jgi:hypothetical protein
VNRESSIVNGLANFEDNNRPCAAENLLPIADCRLPIADCRLPIADCRLPIADCRPTFIKFQYLFLGYITETSK